MIFKEKDCLTFFIKENAVCRFACAFKFILLNFQKNFWECRNARKSPRVICDIYICTSIYSIYTPDTSIQYTQRWWVTVGDSHCRRVTIGTDTPVGKWQLWHCSGDCDNCLLWQISLCFKSSKVWRHFLKNTVSTSDQNAGDLLLLLLLHFPHPNLCQVTLKLSEMKA